MKIYRGVKNILFKDIEVLFRNTSEDFLDYGRGTSYAYEKNLAEEYLKLGAVNIQFSFLLTYEYKMGNTLYLTNKNTGNEDSFDNGIFY